MGYVYEIHVTPDDAHYKQAVDVDNKGVVDDYRLSECNGDGSWRTATADPIPYPTEMVESGPGTGPRHCPVCGGDDVTEML